MWHQASDVAFFLPRLTFEVESGSKNSHLGTVEVRIPRRLEGSDASTQVRAEDYTFTYQYGLDITDRSRKRAAAFQLCVGAAYVRRSVNSESSYRGPISNHYISIDRASTDMSAILAVISPRVNCHGGRANISFGSDLVPIAYAENRLVRTHDMEYGPNHSDFTSIESHDSGRWTPGRLAGERAILMRIFVNLSIGLGGRW